MDIRNVKLIILLFAVVLLINQFLICSNNPNIILIVVDTLRKDHLKLYNSKVEGMPFIENIAKKGIIFNDFIANSSHTVPSHYSIFSSSIPNSVDLRIPDSFVIKLKNLGYKTYGISANPLVNSTYKFDLGFDYFDAESYKNKLNSREILDRFNAFEKLSQQKNVLSDFIQMHLSTTADYVNENIFSLLKSHYGSDQRFFLFINYLEPHEPYFPHSKKSRNINYNIRDSNSTLHEFIKNFSNLNDQYVKKLCELYEGEILYLDGYLKSLIEKLKQLKMFDNTVFILTSDHGELLGEHGLFTHDLGLYDEEIEIPFIIFGKSIKNRTVKEKFSHLDTGKIILGIANEEVGKIANELSAKKNSGNEPIVSVHFFMILEKKNIEIHKIAIPF